MKLKRKVEKKINGRKLTAEHFPKKLKHKYLTTKADIDDVLEKTNFDDKLKRIK